ALAGILGVHAVDPGGHTVPATSGQDALYDLRPRVGTGRFAVLAPHAGRQVVRTGGDSIDPWHTANSVGVLHRLHVLALKNNEQLVVGARVVILRAGAEVEGVNAAADAACADGRVQRGRHGGLGLGAAVDHRHDDAVGAVIQNALDVIVAIGGYASQGDTAGVGDAGEHVRRGFPVHQAMLDVHGQPGEPGPRQEARRGNAAPR